MKYLAVIVAIAVGIAGIVLGGIDDSPGAQLIGVVIIIVAVVLGVRMVRRSRSYAPDQRQGADTAVSSSRE